jgi:hypothetical protein
MRQYNGDATILTINSFSGSHVFQKLSIYENQRYRIKRLEDLTFKGVNIIRRKLR